MMARRERRTRTIVVALGRQRPPARRREGRCLRAVRPYPLEPRAAGGAGPGGVADRRGPRQRAPDRRRPAAQRDGPLVLPPLPVGVLVAGTEGWIGYMIQQSLKNALDRFGVKRDVVTVVTQVVVDPDDPATRTTRSSPSVGPWTRSRPGPCRPTGARAGDAQRVASADRVADPDPDRGARPDPAAAGERDHRHRRGRRRVPGLHRSQAGHRGAGRRDRQGSGRAGPGRGHRCQRRS
jgi:hypothetical protein